MYFQSNLCLFAYGSIFSGMWLYTTQIKTYLLTMVHIVKCPRFNKMHPASKYVHDIQYVKSNLSDFLCFIHTDMEFQLVWSHHKTLCAWNLQPFRHNMVTFSNLAIIKHFPNSFSNANLCVYINGNDGNPTESHTSRWENKTNMTLQTETCVCTYANSLVLELSGEFSLCLFQLLSGCDVFGNHIPHLGLHQLEFGIQLYRTSMYQ